MSLSRTHDISCVDFHLKDLKEFGQLLEGAANAAFPKRLSRYREVHVLMLSWENDNLGVSTEVLELQHVFRQLYFYEVEEWKIPSDHSYKALRQQVNRFLNDFEDKENLLIVYYGGHGFMNDDRQCVWSCTGTSESATVQWSGLQNLLEYAESDTLILLDCCAAASSVSATGSRVTEVIAACGFETWAPGVGEHSFTRSLIDELQYWSHRHTLSVAMLHNRVLSRIKYWKPRFGRTGDHEHRKTPIYIVLSNEGNQRSIGLVPLQGNDLPSMGCVDIPMQGSDSDPSESSVEVQSIAENNAANSSQSSIDQLWPDQGFEHPKVHISLSLQENQTLNTDAWVDWIRSVPALVKYANVDGIYKSGSTLLMLSIPVAIWDLLPKDPAISFIGFVKSSNLLHDSPNPLVASHKSTEIHAGIPSSRDFGSQPFPLSVLEQNDDYELNPRPLWSTSDTYRYKAPSILVNDYDKPGKKGYRRVGVLLLSWRSMEGRTNEDIDQLRRLFSYSFNFRTANLVMDPPYELVALLARLREFHDGYNQSDSLIIIVYDGRGGGLQSDDDVLKCIIDHQESFWGDDLLISNCDCPSDLLASKTSPAEKVELLATAPNSRRNDFTRNDFILRLVDVLFNLLRGNPGGFSTSLLHRELFIRLKDECTPLLVDLVARDLGKIRLRPQP